MASSVAVPARGARRWIAPLLALAGGGAVALGSWLPWMSYFAGLVPLRGWIGLNGRALLVSGLVAAALGVALGRAHGARSRTAARWATGSLGVAVAAAAGWLLIGVRELTQLKSSNAMLAPRAGIGLVVVLVGGAALLVAAFVADSRALSIGDRQPAD